MDIVLSSECDGDRLVGLEQVPEIGPIIVLTCLAAARLVDLSPKRLRMLTTLQSHMTLSTQYCAMTSQSSRIARNTLICLVQKVDHWIIRLGYTFTIFR